MLYTAYQHDAQEGSESCVGGAHDRVMHRSYRSHPVVGMGLRPIPRNPSSAAKTALVFLSGQGDVS